MRLLVYLRDGRTVYLVERRSRLRQLVGEEPWHEKESVRVARGTWNPQTGAYVWTAAFLRYIAKGSISVVEEATRGLDDVIPPAVLAEVSV